MTVGSCFRAVRVAIPDIEEPASCGVNNGKGEVVPGGPTKCQSRTKLHQWKLEGSRCPGLSRWLDDNSPAPAFDQIAPRTNPKLVLLDKEPETLGNQFQVAIRLFCGCLWGDDLPGASSFRVIDLVSHVTRGAVENVFFRYTSIIGEGLRARSPAGQGSEVVLGCEILRQVRILSVGIVRASHDSCNNAADWFGVDPRMEVGCFSRIV